MKSSKRWNKRLIVIIFVHVHPCICVGAYGSNRCCTLSYIHDNNVYEKTVFLLKHKTHTHPRAVCYKKHFWVLACICAEAAGCSCLQRMDNGNRKAAALISRSVSASACIVITITFRHSLLSANIYSGVRLCAVFPKWQSSSSSHTHTYSQSTTHVWCSEFLFG